MKKQLLFVIILLLSSTACDSQNPFNSTEPSPEFTPTPLPTPVTLFQSTISADGQLVLSLPPQVFSFPAGMDGYIKHIYVIPGQTVQKGQLLTEIDDKDLRNALKKAEASLDVLKADIENQRVKPRPSEIKEARSNLSATQKELDRVLNLPSDEAITQAAADLRLQEINLTQAQEAYDAVAYAEGIGMSPQAAELQQATLNYEKAQAAYEQATKPANESEIATAELRVTEAKTRLDKLLAGVSPETEAFNLARIQQSELELAEAQSNLEKAKLYAPWDGIITEVNAAPGVHISGATVTVSMLQPLQFATTNFSERNLADVQVGDKATLYLKTYPGVPFPAVIQRVALQSSSKDGDTALFTVHFDFNNGDLAVRPGMTGRVEIDLDRDE